MPFNQLYKDGRIQEVACWAHCRRKFHDLEQAHGSPLAREALERIAASYAVEDEIRGRPPEERKQVRQTRARPLLQALHDWFEVSLTKLSRKSDTTTAIRYALTLWPALNRYCDDGHLEIDNNSAERSLRAVTLGRKNYVFAGSDAGGERVAVIYSLIWNPNHVQTMNDVVPTILACADLTTTTDGRNLEGAKAIYDEIHLSRL